MVGPVTTGAPKTLMELLLTDPSEFKSVESAAWLHDNFHVGVLAVTAYGFMLIFLPLLKADWNPKPIIFLWNVLLAVFSMWGAINVIPTFLFHSEHGVLNGIHGSVCGGHEFWSEGRIGYAIFVFILSKIPELVDTFWIIVGQKKLMFLHWYHHITVLLSSWLVYRNRSTFMIWPPAMNYFVHSVMYTYYAATQLGYRWKYAYLITYIQIAQMFAGMLSLVYILMFWDSCPGNHLGDVLMSCGGYLTYFLLFVQFFVKRFCLKKSKKKRD